jgi:hypothetical protein
MFSNLPMPGLRSLTALVFGGPLTVAAANDRRVRRAGARPTARSGPSQPSPDASADVTHAVEPEWQGQWRTLRHL